MAASLGQSASLNSIPNAFLGTGIVSNRSNGADGDDAASVGIAPVTGSDSVGSGGQDTAGGLVFLHNGELTSRIVDLAIPGRGFSWKMDRTYRSGVEFDGSLGHNWDFSYNRRLAVQQNGDVIRMDGYGRADRYTRAADGFTAPPGFFTQLTQNKDGTYVERDRRGAKAYFAAPNEHGIAQLTLLIDRNRNQMRFDYMTKANLAACSIHSDGLSFILMIRRRRG
jgi:hypothetical protein